VRSLAGKDLPVHATEHAPTHLAAMPGGDAVPLEQLHGRRVVLLSGIARPQSFRATVEQLGAEVVHELRHRDHHRFTAAEVAAATAAAKAADAWLLTTEKDDARLAAHDAMRYVLRIDLRFLHGEPPPAEFLL
jgi:tetraacyldisaccharide 4'-kinase